VPHILMVGYSRIVLNKLEGQLPDASVSVIEEPDVYRARPPARPLRVVRRVMLAPYQQHGAYLAAAARLHREEPIQAVFPGLEYGVVAAARTAEHLGLPGAGVVAARLLRNKLQLRRRTRARGMPTPSFAELQSEQELRHFLAQHGQVVLKPADRQASVGVLRLDRSADIAEAWQQATAADETGRVAGRRLRRSFLAEKWLRGPEYSTEALVRAGRIEFLNITAKATLSGPSPVEIGHTVPAPMSAPDSYALRAAHADLVQAIGYGTGILHAEWILSEGIPVLIECAGRAPGDLILDLMELSYGIDFYRAVVDLHLAQPIRDLPSSPRQASCIRFLTAPSGRVQSVRGVEEARSQPDLHSIEVTVASGDVVPEVRSSWDRLGPSYRHGKPCHSHLEAGRKPRGEHPCAHRRSAIRAGAASRAPITLAQPAGCSATIRFSIAPTPSTSTATASPSHSSSCGSRRKPVGCRHLNWPHCGTWECQPTSQQMTPSS
jgi:biotin carboxylase